MALAFVVLLRIIKNRNSLFNSVLLIAFLLFAWRSLLVAIGASYYRVHYGSDTRADALLLGCAAGIAFGSGLYRSVSKLAGFLLAACAWSGVIALVWLSFHYISPYDFDATLGEFLIPFCAALIVAEIVWSEKHLMARMLSQRWLAAVGLLSYGLYVWHYPIFLCVQGLHWPVVREIAAEFGLSAAAAAASWFLLERPCLNLKQRFAAARPEVFASREHRGRKEQSDRDTTDEH